MSETAVNAREVSLSAAFLSGSPGSAETAVHVLAQLPRTLVLRLPAKLADREEIQDLARAYGVDGQLAFGDDIADAPEDRMFSACESFAQLAEALSGTDQAPEPFDDSGSPRLADERVALVTNMPTHYRVALLESLDRRLALRGCELRVFFCGAGDTGRPWLVDANAIDFGHEFLRSAVVPVRRRPPLVPVNLGRALARYEPTIVLSAGFSPFVSGRAARFARRRCIPFGIWSGEHEHMQTAKGRLRTAYRRRLLRRTRFAIAYGAASARYLRSVAPSLPTVIGRNTAPVLPEGNAESDKAVLELVSVGDLTDDRKGVDVIVEALAAHPEIACRLTVVGGGAFLGQLKELAGNDARLRFLGHLPPSETQAVFAESDVFLFPTRSEVFGLALVEAMGAGLCVIASTAAGAVEDLCVDGRNCLLVSTHDPTRWGAAIARVAGDSRLRRRLGQRARSTVRGRWTVDHAAGAMIAGLRLAALSKGKP